MILSFIWSDSSLRTGKITWHVHIHTVVSQDCFQPLHSSSNQQELTEPYYT